MRKIVLITAFSLLMHPAVASATNWYELANWFETADLPPVQLEVDRDSLVPKGDLFEARFRFNHLEPQKSGIKGFYKSAEVISLFNCADGKYAPYKRIEFEEQKSMGNEVGRLNREESVIPFYVPLYASMGETMFNYVCKRD